MGTRGRGVGGVGGGAQEHTAVSLGRWSCPLGLLIGVGLDKVFLPLVVPVQTLVRLPDSASSRAT